MEKCILTVTYDPDKETALIFEWHDSENQKVYNQIRSEGDLGRAVKDFVMGMNPGKEEETMATEKDALKGLAEFINAHNEMAKMAQDAKKGCFGKEHKVNKKHDTPDIGNISDRPSADNLDLKIVRDFLKVIKRVSGATEVTLKVRCPNHTQTVLSVKNDGAKED